MRWPIWYDELPVAIPDKPAEGIVDLVDIPHHAHAAAARISSSSSAVYRSVVRIDTCPSSHCTARRLRLPR